MEKFDDINMTSHLGGDSGNAEFQKRAEALIKNTYCSDGQWEKMHLDFQVACIMSAAITSKSTACKSRALLHDFY